MCVVLESHGKNVYTVAMHGSYTQAVVKPNVKRLPVLGEMWWFVAGTLTEDVSDKLPAVGSAFRVTRIGVGEENVDALIEIDAGGELRTVLDNGFTAEVGDRVLLDPSGLTVQYVRPPEKKDKTAPPQQTTWDDIGGLADAKQALRDAVELPHKFPELFKRYKQKPSKGVLLLGPPGCGKTMLGKAVSSSLAQLHGDSSSDGFIYVKGPEILSKWVGEAEAAVRELFTRARKHKAAHGYDAVIFIDEADAILSARGQSIGNTSHTIVPQFLVELDGLEESGAILILATNRASALDPAVTREGRVDRKVKVSRPNAETATEILRIHLRDMPLAFEEDAADFVRILLFSDEYPLVQLNTDDGPLKVHLRHTISGAMLAGVLQKAKGYAINRDISSGHVDGVRREDIAKALATTQEETKNTRLDDVIREVAETTNAIVMSVTAI